MKLTLFITLIYFSFILSYCNSTGSSLDPHPDWCPNAYCPNGLTCQPCDKRFLFILAQGRSGSTTLRNMVNLLPGVRIGGETGNLIQNMHNLYNEILEEQSFIRGVRDFKSSWGHNAYDPYYLSCPAQNMLEALNPPSSIVEDDSSTIVGIKEIRIRTDELMRFLLDHFPCSRFILNIRTDEKGSLSAERTFGTKGDLRKHVPYLFRKYHELLGPQRSYFMNMGEWSNGTNYFNDLAVWLGFEDCSFSNTFHDHSRGYRLDRQIIDVGNECRYTGVEISRLSVTRKK